MNSKILIVFASVCALALAAPQFQPQEQVQERFTQQAQPQQQQQEVHVVRETNNNDGSGNYLYTYELDNGQIASERGSLRQVNENQVVVVSGQYSWVAPDGQTYWVTYTADENGFHPVVGTGAGGIGPGGDAQQIDPNALKSLIGK